MAVTFNGPELRIELPTVGTYDAKIDLYSDWKEWVLVGDNAKYPRAFDTAAGDPIPGGGLDAAYFLRNDLGWRIVVPATTGDIDVIGNLFPRDDTLPTFIRPVGDVLLVRQVVSAMALAIAPDPADLAGLASDTADAVWNKVLP